MTQKHYDLTFHYFRAFAIVSVMLTHMWVGPVLAGSEDAARLQDSLRLCLFHSATIYFVFISGYLFDFVNRRKGPFSPLRFYKSKIVNVFCPYLVLSLLLLAAGWVSHHWFGYDIPFINDGTPVASPGDVLRCLAMGYNSSTTASKLSISWNTVRTHTRNVYGKLGVHSQQELIAMVDDVTAGEG